MTVSHLDCRTDRIKSSNRLRSETQGNTQEPGRETGGVERRERPPTDGATRSTSKRLIGSYLAQEGAICRIVDGFIFEAVGRR